MIGVYEFLRRVAVVCELVNQTGLSEQEAGRILSRVWFEGEGCRR